MEHLTDAIEELEAATIAARGDAVGTPDTWAEAARLSTAREYVSDLVDETYSQDVIDEQYSEAYSEGYGEASRDLADDAGLKYGALLIAARDIVEALKYQPGSVAPEATQLAKALDKVEATA